MRSVQLVESLVLVVIVDGAFELALRVANDFLERDDEDT